MAVSKSIITDTELDILKLLWNGQPLTARELAAGLYERVTTAGMGTVQKLLSRLEEKEMVHRDRRRSLHQFSAAVSREQVAGLQLEEFASKLSGGSLSPFVLHLVQARRLSKKEKSQIRKLLEE